MFGVLIGNMLLPPRGGLWIAAAGASLLAYYYWRKPHKKIVLPTTLADRQGRKVVIRLAVASDRAQVAESIADHSGTGSGTGGDAFLLQEFERMVADPDVSLLFVDDVDGRGLGMMAVVWSGEKESYWQSLRVAGSARGIASPTDPTPLRSSLHGTHVFSGSLFVPQVAASQGCSSASLRASRWSGMAPTPSRAGASCPTTRS